MSLPASLPKSALRGAAAHLADELKAGHVYRREDLARLSNAVDRHLRELVSMGKLQKLAQGLYHVPKQSNFGPLPPADDQVVKGFLRDKEFLVFSPSSYNAVGLGTTQLYNRTLVYNHKRHGVFRLGNRQFDFRVKPRFPKKLSLEFLYVDLLNNLEELAGALTYFYEKTATRVTFEYIIFDGFNDSLEDAAELARFAKCVPCKINIIEYNPIDEGGFQKAHMDKVNAFASYLESKNLVVNVRRSRGKDIDAACGQLANKNKAITDRKEILKPAKN